MVNGVRVKQDGTPYKKRLGRPRGVYKVSRVAVTGYDSLTYENEDEEVDVKVEGLTCHDDTPLDCLATSNEIDTADEVQSAIKIEEHSEDVEQPVSKKLVPIQENTADTAMQNKIDQLTMENTQLMCKSLQLQVDFC